MLRVVDDVPSGERDPLNERARRFSSSDKRRLIWLRFRLVSSFAGHNWKHGLRCALRLNSDLFLEKMDSKKRKVEGREIRSSD